MRVLLTGGSGFVGSHLLKRLSRDPGIRLANLDKSLSSDLAPSLQGRRAESVQYYLGNLLDQDLVERVIADFKPDVVFHLAAESHVDHSIEAPVSSIKANIQGTFNLLEAVRAYYNSRQADTFRFIQASTAEVFGSLEEHEPPWLESSPYRPSSPYSASKASANHLVRAWQRSYGIPAIISYSSNNYGPYQLPEKLIPLVICKSLRDEALPVYGQGAQMRQWLHVEDHACALEAIMRSGSVGRSYNISGSFELCNLDLVKEVCSILDKQRPRPDGTSYTRAIDFVAERPGHDFRYALNNQRLRMELAWRPRIEFKQGLEQTVEWYLENQSWCNDYLETRQEKSRPSGKALSIVA